MQTDQAAKPNWQNVWTRPHSVLLERSIIDVVVRSLLAAIGGYAVSALVAVGIALMLPGKPADTVLVGTMLSFVVFTITVIWVFTVTSLRQVLVKMSVSGCALAMLLWVGG